MTILCLASFFKGPRLLEELAQQGCEIVLVTTGKVEHEPWPGAVHEKFSMPDFENREEVLKGVAYLARSRDFGAIIPLDEYVVDICAWLREHMRIQGKSISEAAYFRDKLLMRLRAREAGLPVPDFVHVLNHAKIAAFVDRTPPPWILKPRAESGSVKMRKLHDTNELWEAVNELGDESSHYLIEAFIEGDIMHVDSVVWDGKVQFAAPHKYGKPPFSVWHEGGVFSSVTVAPKSALHKEAIKQNKDLVAALGLQRGVTHAEFIHAHHDGSLYFLEVAARVGGAHIDALVLETKGVDLWREWGKLEVAAAQGQPYSVKASRDLNGGLLVCLARQETPDMSAYDDPEVSWRHTWDYHAALVVVAKKHERVLELLDAYQHRFAHDFLAIAPPLDHPA